MLGSEQPLDLYKLFMVVKEKGGYDAVCKNGLWDLVGEEYGLGVKVGASVEMVYSKHLSSLETWLKNVADSKFPECDLVNDRVQFGKRLMEVQAGFMLDGDDDDEKVKRVVYGYLDGRKLWGTNRVKGFNPELNGAELETVYDYLDGRKSCGANRVQSKNPESNGVKKVQNGGLVDSNMQDHRANEPSLGNFCNHTDAMETLKEFDADKILIVDVSGMIKNMPGLSDGGKRCENDSHNVDVVKLDPSSVNKESSGRKRKRNSRSEMLSWVSGIAKNPCDPIIASVPEKSKWKSYSNQEIWKQVLLFREAVILKKGSESSSEQQVT